MRYGSVCSGIEAATVAWHQLGWTPAWFSEIEKFPSAVLKHHSPSVPNWGDMTKFQEWPDASVDVLVGGTPCQSFSVAGLRKGLDDPRGNLLLTYLAIADRYRPEWVVWENVPGVLSSNGGRDFGTFLGGLGQLGYGWSYRVLDAQFFGVAQRRRRVFVVANARGWQRAAAVLFERASLSGNPPPRREARKDVAAGATGGACQRRWPAEVASTLNAAFGSKQGLEDQHALGGAELFVPTPVFATSGQTNAAFCADQALALNATNEPPYVAHSLRGEGFDASEGGTGRGTPLMPVAWSQEIADPLTANERRTYTHEGSNNFRTRNVQAVAQPVMFSIMPMNSGKDFKAREVEVAQPLMAGGPVGGNQGGDYVAQPIAPTLPSRSKAGGGMGTDFDCDGGLVAQPVAPALTASNDPSRSPQSSEVTQQVTAVYATAMQVRRLTPVECERLQGFPDGYTNIPWRKSPESPDGPRYKALGNSMAVPCMRWIGKRIAEVDEL
jgi:DNA (cytosine-5)-methyltransferase 1